MPRSAPADKVYVADVLAYYLTVKGDVVAGKKDFEARIGRLSEWWGERTLASVTRINCLAYAKAQNSQSLARRELEDLRSAINMGIAEGMCRDLVKVTLPPKPKSRDRFLTRSEVARLLKTAWSFKEVQKGHATDKRPTRHIAKFILTALYTGSRSSRVWRASFVKRAGHPWVDLQNGLFYREAPGETAAANKKAPPIRLPDRLLAHMRRWRAKGATYVCEYQGRAADPRKAFRKVVERAKLSPDVVRHSLRHTSVTWLMQAGTDKWEVSGYAGMSLETLERTYGHHHPDHQKSVGSAFSSGKAGRLEQKADGPINATQSIEQKEKKAV